MKQQIGTAIVILLIVMNIGAYLTINVPANVRYSNLFGSYATLAYNGQPTFEGIQANLQHIYQTMLSQFPNSIYDYNSTYNTWAPWGHIYENSLSAQQAYLLTAINRTKYYEGQFSSSNASSKLTDTYNLAIANLRNELQCSAIRCNDSNSQNNGIDWVIRGAWFMNKAPSAYWDFYVLIPIDLILIIIAFWLIASSDY